ncbi:hypothetical protein J0910_16435 [Nocardiopsis sp. CNT-189]|uniref:hypothetical protein n=1 Tax=Nocardiopsis oceanisediminis TaxID=2816862 RepID=UPI003B36D8B7
MRTVNTPDDQPGRRADREQGDVGHLAAVLSRRRAELAGRNAVIGGGEVVHALTEAVWAGVRVPAVSCHASADPLRLRPTDAPVSCRRCLRRLSGRDHGVPEGQLTLDAAAPPPGPDPAR